MLSKFRDRWRIFCFQYHLAHDLSFVKFQRELLFWLGLGFILFGIGKYLDIYIFAFIAEHIRTPLLDKIALFLTEKLIQVVLVGLGILTAWRVYKNPDHHSKLAPAFFAVIVTGIMAYILKGFFKIPRPFGVSYYDVLGDLQPLLDISSHSFPSAHTAISFAVLIPLWRISKSIGVFWGIFALLVSLARVYEKVHFPSDIAGGILLGGLIGAFFSHPEVHRLLKILWNFLEFRRQAFHLCTGVCCVFAHWAGILRLRFLAVILIIGLIISFISQRHKIPVISDILKLFDRARDKDFPGRGAFYFLLGVFLTFLIFPVKIAYAAILILSFGDSLNHFISKPFHHCCASIPWNKNKNILGVGLGVLAGTLAAQFFVPFYAAFLGSAVAIFLETIPFRIRKFYIDDNIFVPLIAGGIIGGLLFL
jgi:membrane-associated phospholipid phosphatase/dolichol kinase